MKRIINTTVDLKTKTYNEIVLKQMDTTTFKIKILDDSKIVDLTSQIVDIIFTKPDNTIVQQIASDIDIEKRDCYNFIISRLFKKLWKRENGS